MVIQNYITINQNISSKKYYIFTYAYTKNRCVIGSSGVLGGAKRKIIFCLPTGEWGFMESFIDDFKLRVIPPKCHLCLAMEEVQSCLHQARINATSHSYCSILKYSIFSI